MPIKYTCLQLVCCGTGFLRPSIWPINVVTDYVILSQNTFGFVAEYVWPDSLSKKGRMLSQPLRQQYGSFQTFKALVFVGRFTVVLLVGLQFAEGDGSDSFEILLDRKSVV